MNASLAVDVVSAVGSSVVDKSTMSVDWSILSFISTFLFLLLLNIGARVIFLELSSTGFSISASIYLHISFSYFRRLELYNPSRQKYELLMTFNL